MSGLGFDSVEDREKGAFCLIAHRFGIFLFGTFSPLLCPVFLEQFFFFPIPSPPFLFSHLYILELWGGVTEFYTAENKESHGSYFLHNYVTHV